MAAKEETKKLAEPVMPEKRVSRSALASATNRDRQAVNTLFDRGLPGTPVVDSRARVNRLEGEAFVKKHLSEIGGGAAVDRLKEEKLELEVAELRRQDAMRKGVLFEMRELQEELSSFVADVEATYHKFLYHEFPSKCKGKTEEEIREQLGKYLFEIATAIRASATKVEEKATTPKAP